MEIDYIFKPQIQHCLRQQGGFVWSYRISKRSERRPAIGESLTIKCIKEELQGQAACVRRTWTGSPASIAASLMLPLDLHKEHAVKSTFSDLLSHCERGHNINLAPLYYQQCIHVSSVLHRQETLREPFSSSLLGFLISRKEAEVNNRLTMMLCIV